MSLTPDLLLDRRRLKRALSAWRILAVIAVVAALAVVFVDAAPIGGAHVARLEVSGTITNDRKVIAAIDAATRDDGVRALLLEIDSPGGTVAGGEALHAALSRFAAKKPLVATMAGTAASAGYMIAMPAQRVFARETTLTGSIGVLLQSFEVGPLLEKLGIRPETITGGTLKDQPSMFRPLTEEGRAALQAVVSDLHEQFIAMVAAGRHRSVDQIRPLADGRVFTGRQALPLGLVDAIGGEQEARAWLAAERQVPESLPSRRLDPRSSTERLLGDTVGGVMKTVVSEWLGVDRVWALWQLSQ
jgi:protease-4